MTFGPVSISSAEHTTVSVDSLQIQPIPEAFTKETDDGRLIVTATPSAVSLVRSSATI